jgi:hypothetical protein
MPRTRASASLLTSKLEFTTPSRRKLPSITKPLLICYVWIMLLSNTVNIKLHRRLVLGKSKGIYVGGTLLSILLSIYLYTSGKRQTGIFVGLWAPTVLSLGQTLVEHSKD